MLLPVGQQDGGYEDGNRGVTGIAQLAAFFRLWTGERPDRAANRPSSTHHVYPLSDGQDATTLSDVVEDSIGEDDLSHGVAPASHVRESQAMSADTVAAHAGVVSFSVRTAAA